MFCLVYLVVRTESDLMSLSSENRDIGERHDKIEQVSYFKEYFLKFNSESHQVKSDLD